jgi:hypothetical protein
VTTQRTRTRIHGDALDSQVQWLRSCISYLFMLIILSSLLYTCFILYMPPSVPHPALADTLMSAAHHTEYGSFPVTLLIVSFGQFEVPGPSTNS